MSYDQYHYCNQKGNLDRDDEHYYENNCNEKN